MSHTQVRADKATTNHEKNNYGLFSLSADARTSQGLSLLLYLMIGIAILGIYLQNKSWKANRTTKLIVKGDKAMPSFVQRLCDQRETPAPAPAPVLAPIVVKPPPCPCTTRNPGKTQEVLSKLLPVIK